MNDYFNKIQKLFNELKKKQTEVNDLVKLNEIRSKELDEQCERTSILQNELLQTTKKDDNLVSLQYLRLRGDNETLNREINKLNQRNAQIEQELRETNEKLSSLETSHKLHEQELHNDFQLTQAAILLENDEMQTKLRNQLDEVNRRNRELTNSYVGLRQEFYTAKQGYNQKITELQQKLHSAEEKLKFYQNQTNCNQSITCTANLQSVKYQPLDVSTTKNDTLANTNISKKIPDNCKILNYTINQSINNSPKSSAPPVVVSKRTVPIFTGSGHKNIVSRNTIATDVPALKKCSDSTVPVKKRKLYNPNDLGYLDSLNLGN